MADAAFVPRYPRSWLERVDWLRAENPSLVGLWHLALQCNAIKPLDDVPALRDLARRHGAGKAGWKMLRDHAPRLVAAVHGTAAFRDDALATVFGYARLLGETRLREPPACEFARTIATVGWHLRPDGDAFAIAHPVLLRAAVHEARIRELLHDDGTPAEDAKLRVFIEDEFAAVLYWQLQHAEELRQDFSDRPWRWWRDRQVAWLLRGAPPAGDPSAAEIADDAEWPVLVPPFERDGIAIEEIWSVAGLRREAVRMAHCIGDPRFAKASMQRMYRAYRLARADNDQRFATVGLVRQSGRYAVQEVRGFANADAPELAWRIARELAWWASEVLADP
jgi:hypothetical protein